MVGVGRLDDPVRRPGTGLEVEFGPFGTELSGDDDHQVLDAVDQVVRAAVTAGATRVAFQVVRRA